MKTLRLCFVFVIASTLLHTPIPALASEHGEDVAVQWISSSAEAVPDDLQWGNEAISAAQSLRRSFVNNMDKKLETLRGSGASVLVISKGPNLSEKFPALDLNSKNSQPVGSNEISAFGDWGVEVKAGVPHSDTYGSYASYLVGIPEGTCRIQFALFNWNSWFTPDCKVDSSSPQAILRWSLIDFLANTPTVTGGDLLNFRYQMISYIFENKLDYTLSDGLIKCPSAARIFGESVLATAAEPEEGLPGYKIEIDPDNRWKAKFTVIPIHVELLASTARLSSDGTYIMFVSG